MPTLKQTLLLISLISLGNSAFAQRHHHDAHVHGAAQLTVAYSQNVLEIQLESPAGNIVGFEHPAKTAQQVDSFNTAKNLLQTPGKLFEFLGTQCSSKHYHVDLSSVAPKHTHSEKHEGSEHEHEHKHEHHAHEHEESHNQHSEITATYQFNCQSNNVLQKVKVNLLQHFKGIEELNGDWITDNNQGSSKLTSHKSVLILQ